MLLSPVLSVLFCQSCPVLFCQSSPVLFCQCSPVLFSSKSISSLPQASPCSGTLHAVVQCSTTHTHTHTHNQRQWCLWYGLSLPCSKDFCKVVCEQILAGNKVPGEWIQRNPLPNATWASQERLFAMSPVLVVYLM